MLFGHLNYLLFIAFLICVDFVRLNYSLNELKLPQYFSFKLSQSAYVLYAFSTKVTATNIKKQN